MKCPKCKAKVEFIAGESEFCVQCGADLTAVDPAAAGQKESDSAEVAEKIPANVDFSKVLKSIYAPGQEASPQIHVVTPVVQVSPASVQPVIIRHESAVPVAEDELGSADCVADIPAGNSGDCRCLEVAYNRQIFFLSGSTTVIKLRLTPQINELKSVLLFMETQINGKAVRPVQRCRFAKGVGTTADKLSNQENIHRAAAKPNRQPQWVQAVVPVYFFVNDILRNRRYHRRQKHRG